MFLLINSSLFFLYSDELLILCFSQFLNFFRMASEVPDSIRNFPKCLEEALEFTVEDTSPLFENIIS